MASRSPYKGVPAEKWLAVTQRLIAKHPLQPNTILQAVLASWDVLWQTKVGAFPTEIALAQIELPAIVVGYFLERLVAKHLATSLPGLWRGAETKDDKDLVYVPDPSFSVEIKCSGQLGTHIYGNRSYAQVLQDTRRVRKDKSGYYITVNFYGDRLFLVRFGWIDASDWKPQKAPTGQMAGLDDAVYAHKLLSVPGDYQLEAPVEVLPGIGAKRAEELASLGVVTVAQLIAFGGSLHPKLAQLRQDARDHALRGHLPGGGSDVQ